VEGKEQDRIQISNRFAAWENTEMDINSFGKLIERIKTFQPKTV
jgi:hypothetical protein